MTTGYYILNGESTTSGYYPDYNVLLEDIPDYGFETTSFSNEETDITIPSNALSAYTGFGVYIPLPANLSMKIGANLKYGITDMELEPSPVLTDPGQTFLRYGGIEIGLAYHLFPLPKNINK